MTAGQALPVLVLLATAALGAASGRTEDLEGANRLYASGAFEESAHLLDGLIRDGRLDREQTAMAEFNRGNALYRDGRYALAREAYERAAVGSRVLAVVGNATYNIGNCFFREAEARIAEGNLEQATEGLESALSAYRRTLELNSDHANAAANLEVARTVLKGLGDQLAKYDEVRKIQREITQELKTLIAGQTGVIQENQDPSVATDDVRRAQAGLRERTRRLLGRYDALLTLLERLQAKSQESNPYTESRRHVVLAEGHQGRALTRLDADDRDSAAPSETASLEELQRALEIITPPQEEDRNEQSRGGSQQGDDPEEAPRDQGGGESQSSSPAPADGEGGAEGDSQAGDGGSSGSAATNERPEDVLREEGELRRARDGGLDGRGSVEKDW